VKTWVDFCRRYRGILNSDIIHVRRPGGRDIDCILHVNSQLKQKGLAMVYNPLNERVNRKLRLPLYYTGLTTVARIREQERSVQEFKLDCGFEVELTLDMAPRSVTWYVIE